MLPAHAKYRETQFFGSLDGLRALSIIGVVWVHTWFGTPYFQWLAKIPILRSGASGVDVFFTISGFLITTLLLREHAKYGTISLKHFYFRRTLRIWPLYYGVMGLYVALVLLLETDTTRKAMFFENLPAYASYTYNWWWVGTASPVIFNFAWSLSTEEQFYIVWPFMLKFCGRLWPVAILGAITALRIEADYGMLDGLPIVGTLPYRIILSIAVPICVGALLAQALHRRRGFKLMRRMVGARWSAPLALMLFVMALATEWPIRPLLTWTALPLLVGSCVIREDNGLAAILRFRPLAFIGIVSYGVYMYNMLAVAVVRQTLSRIGIEHPAIQFPVVFGLALLTAWLSYKFFETPFLRAKNWFSHKRSAVKRAEDASIPVGALVHA